MYDLLKFYQWPYLYHFTDSRNLPLIKEKGGLYSYKKLNDMDFFHDVQCGGNGVSHKADEIKFVDTYVHLCFTRESPIEMRARKVKRIKETAWIKVDREVLLTDGVRYSDDISNKHTARLYEAAEAEQVLDREALFVMLDYTDPQMLHRLWRAQRYEALIPDCIPLEYLHYKHFFTKKKTAPVMWPVPGRRPQQQL